MPNYTFWSLDTRQIGAALANPNGQLYNWNTNSWEQVNNAVYNTHIKPFNSVFPSGGNCQYVTKLDVDASLIDGTDGLSFLMFDLTDINNPVATDLFGHGLYSNASVQPNIAIGFRFNG